MNKENKFKYNNDLANAVYQGNEDLVKSLLETGLYDVNNSPRSIYSPLASAIIRGHVNIVKLLLESDELELNLYNQYTYKLLLVSIVNEDISIVNRIINHPNFKFDKEKLSEILTDSIKYNKIYFVKIILSNDKFGFNRIVFDQSIAKAIDDGSFNVFDSDPKHVEALFCAIRYFPEVNQNLTNEKLSKMEEEKVRKLPSEEDIYKKSNNNKRLQEIFLKQFVYDYNIKNYREKENNEPLSKEDLRFIYEVDEVYEGFGPNIDLRIEMLRKGRNKRKDLALVFNCKENYISLSEEEALMGNTLYFKGVLRLRSLTKLEPGYLPKTLTGYLDLGGLTKLEPGCLPENINGGLLLDGLTKLEPGCFPETLNGDLCLSGLTKLEPGCLPKTLTGYLDLGGLTKLEPGCLPKTINGKVYLNNLTKLEPGLFPKNFKCNHIDAPKEILKQIKQRIIESIEYYKNIELLEEPSLGKTK